MTVEPAPPPYVDTVAALLTAQDGVVSRTQLVDADCEPHDIERLLRRKELFVAIPGVYIHHNGPRSWQQRAWVAVLACWPAALAGASALRAESGPGLRGFDEAATIEVAVDVSRTVRDKPDVRVRRMAGLTDRTRWNASPPRVRYEEAVLDVVAGLAREWDVIEVCAAAVRGRCTTAERLAKALKARHRFPRRAWLGRVLADVAAGTASVLEHGYLHRVERAHGCRRRTGSGRTGSPAVASTATRPIRRTTSTSSSTAASTTAHSPTGTATWSGISTPPATVGGASGWGGARSTTGPATRRPRSPGSSRSAAGRARRPRAPRPARSGPTDSRSARGCHARTSSLGRRASVGLPVVLPVVLPVGQPPGRASRR